MRLVTGHKNKDQVLMFCSTDGRGRKMDFNSLQHKEINWEVTSVLIAPIGHYDCIRAPACHTVHLTNISNWHL